MVNGNATKQPIVVRITGIREKVVNGKSETVLELLDERSNDTFEISSSKKTVEDLYKEQVFSLYKEKRKTSKLSKEEIIKESVAEAKQCFFKMKPSQIDSSCSDNDFYLYKYQPISNKNIKDTSGNYVTENFGIMRKLIT